MAEARWVNLVAAAACAIGAVNWAIWVGPGFGLHVNEFGFLRFNLAVWPALAGIVMAIKFLGRAVGTPRLALAAILLVAGRFALRGLQACRSRGDCQRFGARHNDDLFSAFPFRPTVRNGGVMRHDDPDFFWRRFAAFREISQAGAVPLRPHCVRFRSEVFADFADCHFVIRCAHFRFVSRRCAEQM